MSVRVLCRLRSNSPHATVHRVPQHLKGRNTWLHLNESFLVGILYTVFSALLPPYVASIPVLLGGGVFGLLLAFAAASAGTAAAVLGMPWGWVAFVCVVALSSPLISGPLPTLTSLGILAMAYTGATFFTAAIPMVDPGLHMSLPVQDVH